MGWFKRNKESSASGDAMARRIAERILRYQRKIANRLNAKAENVERKKMIVLLLALGIAFGCYCLWLVARIFS